MFRCLHLGQRIHHPVFIGAFDRRKLRSIFRCVVLSATNPAFASRSPSGTPEYVSSAFVCSLWTFTVFCGIAFNSARREHRRLAIHGQSQAGRRRGSRLRHRPFRPSSPPRPAPAQPQCRDPQSTSPQPTSQTYASHDFPRLMPFSLTRRRRILKVCRS